MSLYNGDNKSAVTATSASRASTPSVREPNKRGGLTLNAGAEAWAHKLEGDCNCGATHGNVPARPTPARKKAASPASRIVNVSDYRDEQGRQLFQVVRFEPKKFRQRKAKPGGGWEWNIEGVRCVLYRLPELIAANPEQPVFICEGEKDVDRLISLGLVATSNPMGAKKWLNEYSPFLTGRHSIILEDNDQDGREHVQLVAQSLLGKAASIKVLALPGLSDRGDVSDYLDAGHDEAELLVLAAACPEWAPDAQEGAKEYLATIATISVNGEGPADVQPALGHLPEACWRLFTDEYLRAVEGVTEASDVHHYYAILCAAGAVLGRRAYFHYAYRLYPNSYVLSVGSAGMSRKTTTQRLATDVVERVDPALKIARASGSGEGLLDMLAGADVTEAVADPIHNRVLLVQSEMAQLLAKGRQEATGTLVPILLEAYDAPPVINPPTRANKIRAEKPTLSMLGASTPSQLQRYMMGHEVYGGFVSRLMVAVGEPKAPIPLPRKVDPSRFNKVVGMLHDATERWKTPTEFRMSAEAEDAWKQFYITWSSQQQGLGDKADIVSRTTSHAIKLALLFAALENDDPTIELGQIEAAIAAAEFVQAGALEVFGDFGSTKAARIERRMINKVRKTPGITRRLLQQHIGGQVSGGLDARGFNRSCDALLRTGELIELNGALHVGE